MAVTIDGVTISYLTAQPFSYATPSSISGRAFRQWVIEGLVPEATWLALIDSYEAYRTAKLAEEDPETTFVKGTTIQFSGSGPGGQSWSNIDTYYSSAPEGEQTGAFIRVSLELIDADQALAVWQQIAAEEGTGGGGTGYNYGDFTLWGVDITALSEQPDGYQDPPSAELTASGTHYITGALVPVQTKNITGTVTEAGWLALMAGYADAVRNSPASGDWYPTTAPTGEAYTVGGQTKYTVSIELVKLL